MKCRLLFTMQAGPTAPDELCIVEDGIRFLPVGTELDHPGAYRLVHGGHAEATDDECRAKVKTLNKNDAGLLRQIHKRIIDEQADFIEEIADEYDDEDE